MVPSLPDGETAEHTYGNATATWNDDNTEAEVTVSCTVCQDKELDALLDDQNKDTQELTKTAKTKDIKVEKPDGFDCEKGGNVTYVATATVDGKEYKVSKSVTVKAGQHTYGKPSYSWSKDDKGNMICAATFTCEKCKKVEIVPVKENATTDNGTIIAEKVEPTCTEDGTYTYKAIVKFQGESYTETKVETVKKTGHKYDNNGVCTVCGHKRPTITLTSKKEVYTGKSISIDAPKVVGDVKDLKYSYYSDNACKNEISEPTDPGVYYVKVTADAGVTSNIATLTIVPQTTKVTTVANATSYMTVSWNKVNKASGYYVYRSTNGKKFTKIATVKSGNTVKYNDKKATKNGQKYVYKVVTYYNGNQTVSSAYSATKTGYRLSTMKVSSLTNKKGKKAYIKWKKNSKSTGYQIRYVTGKSKAKTVKASSKAKTKTISKLKKGKTYKVRIRSYKKVSNVTYYSAWSKQKSVKIKK